MLEFLLKGLSYGVILSLLVGPIIFTLLQASLERGAKMALTIGLGVWISDLIFITCVFLFISQIQDISVLPNFKFLLGSIGSVVLIAFGIVTLLNNKSVDRSQKVKKNGYAAHFIKGFLINTLNPFTVLFWVAMSSEVIANDANTAQTIVFFAAILSVIVLTDSIKVILAKRLSMYLTPKHILNFRKIVGIILIAFGIILIYRITL